MNNPGTKNLGDRALTTALTGEVITSQPDSQGSTQEYIENLEGMLAATLQANFTYGSGGTSVKADIEISCDQGISWIPIVRFAFTTSSAEKVVNLSGLTPKTTPYTPASLSDDTAVDGIFGDRMRCKITSVGTYAGNTSISIRLMAR